LRNQIKLKRIEIQETTKQTKEEKKLIQEERNLIKEQVGKAKETKKIEKENPEILWEEDFNRFQNSILFKQFQQILDSIYKHEGHTRVESRFSNSYEPTYDFEINTEILIFADINNLINITNGKTISLTEKGRFFAQRYSQLKSFKNT
jgi:hypothetical protein